MSSNFVCFGAIMKSKGESGSWIGQFATAWVWLKRAWDFGGLHSGPWVFIGYGFLLSLFCLAILFVLGIS